MTHCKAGKDVCSCPHADADHAADAAETPAVTQEPGRGPGFMHIDGGDGGRGELGRRTLTEAESTQKGAFQPAHPWWGSDTWRHTHTHTHTYGYFDS